MLQWMGGSRRKVTTTRKSTYNRQKQYFEQRKRQKQMTEQENCVDGKYKFINHDGLRSLDILSLTNLTEAAQKTINNSKMDAGSSHGAFHASNSLPSLPLNKMIPQHCVDFDETKQTSEGQQQIQTQNKLSASTSFNIKQSIHNLSDKTDNKLDRLKIQPPCNNSSCNNFAKTNQKRMTQDYLSVIDFLNDDGAQINSEGKSAHEAHVAFSVEGLGKIGTETPVHSPRQTIRVSFADDSSPRKASKWMKSSKKFKSIQDGLGLDFGFSLEGSPPELRGKMHASENYLDYSQGSYFSDIEFVPINDYSNSSGKFAEKDHIYKPSVCKKESVSNGRLDKLHNDFLDDQKIDGVWMNQSFYTPNDESDFSQVNFSDDCGHAFKDFYIQDQRCMTGIEKRSAISEQSRPLNNNPMKDRYHDFVSSKEKRHPVVKRALHFEHVTDHQSWPFQDMEDATDNVSLLSDESSSSTAVMFERKNTSGFKLSNHRGDDIFHRAKFQENSVGKGEMRKRAKELAFDDQFEVMQEKPSDVLGKGNVSNQWMSRPSDCLRKPSAHQGISQTHHSSLCEEGHDIFFVESANTLPRTSWVNGEILEQEVSKDDPFGVYSPLSTISEMAYGRSTPKVPLSQNPSQTVLASDAAPGCRDHGEMRHETPQSSANHKSGNYSQSVDPSVTAVEVSSKCERIVSNKLISFGGNAALPSQCANKDKDNTASSNANAARNGSDAGSPSYQVMLESYVLQLLCVQKVLMNSPIQDGAKKG